MEAREGRCLAEEPEGESCGDFEEFGMKEDPNRDELEEDEEDVEKGKVQLEALT